MALTIVDSDILINVARGDTEAINCLSRLEETSVLAVSAVTQMELIVGCRNKTELRDLEKFFKRFQILPITNQISDYAASLLKTYFLSHGLLIADSLIASTAIIHNETFITKNQRDFRFIKGLNLLPYP
ncbi:MAG TPA: type II toxin-antitoxin system VapC family toxin [Pyrinomonadaceae bacterium]|nr:type II toxin-antitoxin system VapC family toxin [Pyrinomonadaceae bacterium]